MVCAMEMEFKFGQMVLDMKVNGLRIKLMARANSGMQMVTFMKVIGETIRQMDMVSIYM